MARALVNHDDYSGNGRSSSEGSPEPEVLGESGSGPNGASRTPCTPEIIDLASQDPTSTEDPVEKEPLFSPRGYQIEMFEESCKQNIIVAMDTGSGKTHVAVLRIQAELEKQSESDKIVWFLAPTTHLCEQQSRVLRSHITAAKIKMLTVADKVDTWSDARIWDDYLRKVHVVVSTYQVLLDAVTHAFVPISRLSLIVFDEADGLPHPAILGLTASPIMKSHPKHIEKLERTLDAVCKAPLVHRDELLAAVNRPTVSPVTIPTSGRVWSGTKSMLSLGKVASSLDIRTDPWILKLASDGSEKSKRKLQEAFLKRETHCIKLMHTFYNRSNEVLRQLGSWAADYYIHTSITRFLQDLNQDPSLSESLSQQEDLYAAEALRTVHVEPPCPLSNARASDFSAKFNALIGELKSVPDGTKCIIFVRQTVTVAVLAHMLSSIPSLQARFRVGTVVGSSNYDGRRREVGDLSAIKQTLHLDEFRSDKKNLLVSTSVAEEGIDVPACNCVVCFDPPDNVKSFIQRRGRARAENSKLILLMEPDTTKPQDWERFEEEMRRYYEDDSRILQELSEREKLDMDTSDEPFLYVPSTRARLDFAQAKGHLAHFCQKVTQKLYVDSEPYYVSQRISNPDDDRDLFTATVYLPSSVAPAPRQVRSRRAWYSEKNAFKDAAFEAFKAVREAGLVNDNLMPLIDDILEGVETRSSTKKVNGAWDPWHDVGRLWKESEQLVRREIRLMDGSKVIAKFDASLPCAFPTVSSFDVYWDAQNTWTVEISDECHSIPAGSQGEDQSAVLLDLALGNRWAVENSAHILHLRSSEDFAFGSHKGQKITNREVLSPEFLVRDEKRRPYIFLEWLPSKPAPELVKEFVYLFSEEPVDGPWLAVKKFPRPKPLLSPSRGRMTAPVADGRYPFAIPVSHCTVDTIDRSKVYFGAVLSSIMRMFELYYTADKLRETLLREVRFSNSSLVLTAISSRAVGLPTDYERLEFFGDAILKLAATLAVMVKHPNFPEGYLSAKKVNIISNSRLSRAAVETGLDRFILTEPFNPKNWRPRYIKDYISGEGDIAPPSKRNMSTKTLADVVEALIGASFQDGGMPKALACLRTFMPEVEWHDFPDALAILFDRKKKQHDVTEVLPFYEGLEDLIGYTFRNKALLIEAITHDSWQLSRSHESSMQVLELLGDAVLDAVITLFLWNQELQKPELTNTQMAFLRMATVNADLLGFFVMEWRTTREATSISRDASHTTSVSREPLAFWQFLRKGSTAMIDLQLKAEERHAAEREGILNAMAHEDSFPWARLAHLSLPKFLSDMFEALLGAVFVDSGSLKACAAIVDRIGITPYLRRILADGVETKHPKNKLGEIATSRRVRYVTDRVASEVTSTSAPGSDGGGVGDKGTDTKLEHVCSVFVDGELIVTATGGVSAHEIVTRAADEAYHILLAQQKQNPKENQNQNQPLKTKTKKRKGYEEDDNQDDGIADADVIMTG
ncbi:RNase3 domain-containing protein [Xylariaceae sp. FL0594]|nr:RNase3 domain-containing protein [Xylariaceae sp. FL0594]